MSTYVNRWQWLETLASECGPPGATTRHILHAISIHMNAQGESAWPSTATLALRTGLSERAVSKHVKVARSGGWVEVTKRRQAGQGWQVNQYRATVPCHAVGCVPKMKKHTERGSVYSTKQTERHNKTNGTSRQNTPNEVPTNSPLNNSVIGEPRRASQDAGGRELYEDIYGPSKIWDSSTRAMVALLEAKQLPGDQTKWVHRQLGSN